MLALFFSIRLFSLWCSQLQRVARVHGNGATRQLGNQTFLYSSKPDEDFKDPVHANHNGPATKPDPEEDVRYRLHECGAQNSGVAQRCSHILQSPNVR